MAPSAALDTASLTNVVHLDRGRKHAPEPLVDGQDARVSRLASMMSRAGGQVPRRLWLTLLLLTTLQSG